MEVLNELLEAMKPKGYDEMFKQVDILFEGKSRESRLLCTLIVEKVFEVKVKTKITDEQIKDLIENNTLHVLFEDGEADSVIHDVMFNATDEMKKFIYKCIELSFIYLTSECNCPKCTAKRKEEGVKDA